MNPTETIIPIFGIHEPSGIKAFLGTGAFIDEPSLVVTANHVVRDWNGPFGIVKLPVETRHPMRANLVAKNQDSDLALLEVPEYSPEQALELAQDDEIKSNKTVVCLEYSTTRSRDGVIYLAPATRMGNVTRKVDLRERYGQAGEDALELSFPALKGASGAPVISSTNGRLWGIIIANVSYHLLPTQVVTVLDERNQILEETQFMLPQGLAVHVKHLRAMLQDLGASKNTPATD